MTQRDSQVQILNSGYLQTLIWKVVPCIFIPVLCFIFSEKKTSGMKKRQKIVAISAIFQVEQLQKMIWRGSSIGPQPQIIYKSLDIQIYFMQTSNNSISLKRRYSYISIKKRQLLVKEVLDQGKSLSKTSKRLNIRLSTAKLILKKYKLHGRFFMKKTQHRKNHSFKNIEQLPTPQENPKQSSAEEEINAVLETSNNCLHSPSYGIGLDSSCLMSYLIYYPMSDLGVGWNGWNMLPIAYLQ